MRLSAAALAAALLSGPLAAAPGSAAAWEVVPEASSVTFEYLRGGRPAEGRFGRFEGSGDFDPGDPAATRFRLVIDAASIDLGTPVESAFATSAEWFDSDHYPEVVYVLNGLVSTGDDRYVATGELTIRGTTESVRTPVTLTIDGNSAHATGNVRVMRRDFLLGVGPSELFLDIGAEVSVRFDIQARCAC